VNRRQRVSHILRQKLRKGRQNPAFSLFRTHSFDSSIATGTAFPVRTEPITFSTKIKITNTTPAGVVFELGSATTGVAVWIAAADRKIYAGLGDASAADGVTLTGPVVKNGQELEIVLACIPANGKARLWMDGVLVASGQAANEEFPNGWADTEAGAVGAVGTSVTTRVPVGDRISLTGASVVHPLSAYQNQRPRQFHEVA